jgi:hypothetical protein
VEEGYIVMTVNSRRFLLLYQHRVGGLYWYIGIDEVGFITWEVVYIVLQTDHTVAALVPA